MIKLTALAIISAYGKVVITWMFGLNLEAQDPSVLTCLCALVGLALSSDISDWRYNSSPYLDLVVMDCDLLWLNVDLISVFYIGLAILHTRCSSSYIHYIVF